MNFVIRLLVNALALWVATQLVPGVVFTGEWPTLIGVAIVFGLVNAIAKPVTKVVTFPIIILTFGFFLLVINGLMLMLTSAVSGWFSLGFDVSGFEAAFWGALVVSLVNAAASLIMRESDSYRR